jgi:GMP synthase (glutamine-hydrolysing)
MPKIIVVQHAEAEGLGRIAGALALHAIEVEFVAHDAPLPSITFAQSEPPSLSVHKGTASPESARNGLIVLGGPMGAHETTRYPRLQGERRLIEAALHAQVPILGICLGSQLLASVLGAEVYRGASLEIGFADVTFAPAAQHDALFGALPETICPLHWHGDVFALPEGATHLARSAKTAHQAFRYGARAWGMLFHLEAETAEVRAMTRAFPEEVSAGGATSEALISASLESGALLAKWAKSVFGAWAKLVLASR